MEVLQRLLDQLLPLSDTDQRPAQQVWDRSVRAAPKDRPPLTYEQRVETARREGVPGRQRGDPSTATTLASDLSR
ncbi:hypothetical protein QWM81_04780 [Streptomyces ficellus]|uniref:Uncharacterized protein n=1 Tax=Streptomyces ficellus TaxID=1977088 RepID=A0ABT7Z1J9_9ACTN|nr:hypothetical protein [Streptomyces ficellus]MDN3293373.1 hypothetical protein [Streptomyces ficellus]